MKDPTKHLLEQIIVMLCYLPEVPQLAKTELLNRATFCGIHLGAAKEPGIEADAKITGSKYINGGDDTDCYGRTA